MTKSIYTFLLCLLTLQWVCGQQATPIQDLYVDPQAIIKTTQDPLRPSKAAFYSALLPGMGQIYNKDYWKVPIVYAAIGTSAYCYVKNNNEYHRYRDAYKRRLAGFNDDEFQGERYLDDQRLIDAQKVFQRNRDLSLILTIGFYVLNIVEANVSAHLKQFNVSSDLTINPDWYRDDLNTSNNLGLTIKYNF